MKIKNLATLFIVLLCVIFGIASPEPVRAQLPPGLPITPENYAAAHFFGAPSGVDVDHFSMGGAGVADDSSAWQGNPAGVLAAQQPELLTYYQRTGFDAIPDFLSGFLGYAQTVGNAKRMAIKVSIFPVSASGSLAGTPLSASVKENDPGIELAYRANRKLSLGVALSYISTRSDYTLPGVGVVTRLESRPTGIGGRLGAIYRINNRLSVGATVDRYSEKVKQSIPALNVPATTFVFDSKAYRVGLSWCLNPSQKLLLDYEATQLEGEDVRITQRHYHLGFEQKWKDWAVRVGSYDGRPTGGIGLQRGNYNLAYGFSNRYKENLIGQGARTSHAVQLRVNF